ncbi:MAG: MYXO-CTERM sorting domain-containing protein, partial [Myxococcota bacterium]
GATCVDATCVSDGSTPPEDPSAPTPANGCASAPPTVLGVMLGLYVIGRRRRRQTGTKLPKNQRFSRT